MRYRRQFLSWVGVVFGAVVLLTSCAYDARVRQLSSAEQAEFRLYRKIMTGTQTHTYLAKATAAERSAYLREIGLAQRFEALDPLDREAVQQGFLREGMSVDALRFVWGEPNSIDGDARRSAHWYYLGSSFGMSEYGNRYGHYATRVEVFLTNGKVVAWIDTVPNPQEDGGDSRRQ